MDPEPTDIATKLAKAFIFVSLLMGVMMALSASNLVREYLIEPMAAIWGMI